MDAIDTEVLATLRDDVLRPSVVERTIELALEELAPGRHDRRRSKLELDAAALEAECVRLAEAIARGGPLDVLLARLTERRTRRHEIEIQLGQTAPIVVACDLRALEGRLREKLEDWRGLLLRNVQEARSVLRTLLVGPLRFSPLVNDGRRAYRFEGAIALDRLVAGVVDLPTKMASPTGFAASPC